MKADADENLIVYFGGQYMPLHEAHVGILTHALHYGTGVFEGVRAHWDEAIRVVYSAAPRALRTMEAELGILHIEVPDSAEELADHSRTDASQWFPNQYVREAHRL